MSPGVDLEARVRVADVVAAVERALEGLFSRMHQKVALKSRRIGELTQTSADIAFVLFFCAVNRIMTKNIALKHRQRVEEPKKRTNLL